MKIKNIALALALAIILYGQSTMAQAEKLEQEFIITAYYSPRPNQCCYVRGSLLADIKLNGGGVKGASGKRVHSGMAAAPSSYPFGTRIVLPGLGTVTVEDRGGAINVLPGNVHRLDLWVGEGEEGLARALAFGVRRVRGTVFKPGTEQPSESISLDSFAAPMSALRPYVAEEQDLISFRSKKGDSGMGVLILQEHLQRLGYFPSKITGTFGEVTQNSLGNFLTDYELKEADDSLSEKTAAFIVAAVERREAKKPIGSFVNANSSSSVIKEAQRTLRFLGYYRGRTNGIFDNRLRDAILMLQKDEKIVASARDRGAGRIGPQTHRKLFLRWRARLTAIAAKRILMLRRIDELLVTKGYLFDRPIGKGDKGTQVRLLQRFLAHYGYIGSDRITGFFGTETEQAVIAYQRKSGLIKNDREKGAGYVGPATSQALRREVRHLVLSRIRAAGWNAVTEREFL